jgi:hypothetical protein
VLQNSGIEFVGIVDVEIAAFGNEDLLEFVFCDASFEDGRKPQGAAARFSTVDQRFVRQIGIL